MKPSRVAGLLFFDDEFEGVDDGPLELSRSWTSPIEGNDVEDVEVVLVFFAAAGRRRPRGVQKYCGR